MQDAETIYPLKQVHFHMIPKPNEEEGLGISWPQQNPGQEKLKKLAEELKSKM